MVDIVEYKEVKMVTTDDMYDVLNQAQRLTNKLTGQPAHCSVSSAAVMTMRFDPLEVYLWIKSNPETYSDLLTEHQLRLIPSGRVARLNK